MNLFRLAGDMSHLLSVLVLLLKIRATKSCRGAGRGWWRRAGGLQANGATRRCAGRPGTAAAAAAARAGVDRRSVGCLRLPARHLAQDAGAVRPRICHALPGPLLLVHLAVSIGCRQGAGQLPLPADAQSKGCILPHSARCPTAGCHSRQPPPTPARPPLLPRSYNSIMKVTFIATAVSIIRYMRFDKVVKQTYDKEQVRLRHPPTSPAGCDCSCRAADVFEQRSCRGVAVPPGVP